MGGEVLSIGHSTHSYERFLSLLRAARVTAIADVRSSPYSRHFSHFSRILLQAELKADGIAYAYLGEELGGRPKNKQYFLNGVADYEKMAQSPAFLSGITRVLKGSRDYRIALLCSEHDPMDCHRCLLVGRALKAKDADIRHILASGRQMSQSEIEAQLLSAAKNGDDDMFASQDERLAAAYKLRAQRIAYSGSTLVPAAAAE